MDIFKSGTWVGRHPGKTGMMEAKGGSERDRMRERIVSLRREIQLEEDRRTFFSKFFRVC